MIGKEERENMEERERKGKKKKGEEGKGRTRRQNPPTVTKSIEINCKLIGFGANKPFSPNSFIYVFLHAKNFIFKQGK